ncbi:MAG: hypothetical protein KatS3mg111_2861 [Pirellulaceae bacterium]|nr:MAG: hypothetical protein KatS3mg111_2861 [Pirellulaceae bacterium]
MAEPPQLPPDRHFSPDPSPDEHRPRDPGADQVPQKSISHPPDHSLNPYAPITEHQTHHPIARAALPAYYWTALIVSLLLGALLWPIVPSLSLYGIISVVAAAFRVPLLQKRMQRESGRAVQDLPAPLVLMLTSTILCAILLVASMIAFVAICLPSGWLLVMINDSLGAGLVFPFGLGIAAGLVTFFFLFRLSLRLPL